VGAARQQEPEEATVAARPAPAEAQTAAAPSPGGPLTAARVVALQRLFGNAAVSALLDDRRGADAAPAPARQGARPLGRSILDDVAAAGAGATAVLEEAPSGAAGAAAGAVEGAVEGAAAAASGAAGAVGGAAEGAVEGAAAAASGAAGAVGGAAERAAGAAGAAAGAAGGAMEGAAGAAGGAMAGAEGAAGAAAGAAGGAMAGAAGAAGAAGDAMAGAAGGAMEGAAGAAGAAAGAAGGAMAGAAGAAGGATEGAGAAAGGAMAGAAGAAGGAMEGAGAAAGAAGGAMAGAAGAAGGAMEGAAGAAGAAGGAMAGAAGAAGAAGGAMAGAAGAAGAAGGAMAGAAGAAGAAGGAAAGGAHSAAGPAEAASASGGAGAGVIKDPHQDPRFQAMKGHTHTAAGGAKAHAPAKAGAAAAQAAAVGPGNDVASQAAGAQVDEMSQRQPGVFDRQGFIEAVKKAIDNAAPKNLEEADDFKDSGGAAKVKGEVSGLVKSGKEGSEKDIKDATTAAPDTSKATPKQVTPMTPEEIGAPTSSVGAAGAMPPPVPATATDLSAGPAEIDDKMAEAEVTDEQVQKSNEPDFSAALGERDKAREHAAQAPAGFRKDEQATLAKAHGGAEAAEVAQLQGMHGAKGKAFAKALGHKQEAKGADEGKRAKVATDIQGIYDRTKADVQKNLDGLDGKVDAAFSQGEGAARKRFEDYVGARMDAYKDDRYSGLLGKGRWLKDKLMGMPSAVNQFYAQGRTTYVAEMDAVIGQVADIVGGELTAARARIASGKAEVHKYVAGLPADLQQIGKEAEGNLEAQFEQLTSDVEAKQNDLIDSLARKYVDAREAVDARIDEMKAANRGLVDKALDAVVGVVKTILKLKDMLLNVLAKAADVIGDIISDPIGFLGKMIDGVKAGLDRFVGNIETHLQEGLMGWLFGALGSAGIVLPKMFDISGILDLVLQVLGLTYRSIRARVVKLVGEPMMARMEQTVDVFKTLATEGLGGLWKWIKEKIGDFEDMVLGSIKTFIVEKVIKAGITWLIAFLNPAAAFIKACKAIYDIVMFLVERGSEIMSFVSSILDSVGAIAKGALGIVAEKVEGSLAKALPLAISFLASLLGLGGISEKIHSVIETVRAPINKAVDFVVMGGVKAAKKLFGGAASFVKGKVKGAKDWATGKVEAGKSWVKGKAGGIRDRLTGRGAPAAAGPEASDEVKMEAGQEVEKRTPGTMASPEALDEVVGGVLADFRPKGLKDLRAVREPGNPGTYDILARTTKKVATARAFDPLGKDYFDPTDPAIAADMTAAGVTSFGPWVWDSKVPRWKVEEATPNPNFAGYTLADCVDTPIYDAEKLTVKDERGNKTSLVGLRRRAAMKKLFGISSGVIDKLLAHDQGKSPRPFVSLTAEDAACGGHSAQRHILGQGDMPTQRQVALRAAFQQVNGTPMALDAAGVASVFANEGAATAAVQAALAAELIPNWPAHMATLAKGTQVKINASVSVAAAAFEKFDSPKGSPYPDSEMPTYLDGSKPGKRELYRGDFKGSPGDPGAPDPAKDPLTSGGPCVQGSVYLIIDPSPNYATGWAIYTAYPKP
jgi:hypothetical protein